MIDFKDISVEEASVILMFNSEYAYNFVYRNPVLFQEFYDSDLSIAEFIYTRHWIEFCESLHKTPLDDAIRVYDN